MGRHAGWLTAASVLARRARGRRPASGLRPRGGLHVDELPRRRRPRLQAARPLPRRRRRRAIHDADGATLIESQGEGLARQRAALRHRRARRLLADDDQAEARREAARARRHVRLPAALLRRACVSRSTPPRRARSAARAVRTALAGERTRLDRDQARAAARCYKALRAHGARNVAKATGEALTGLP